ncbi:acid protease [Hypoxylon fragiforme]|uniref:acid protease n=1 Tax=Hypoxylon fragiforme TaxID=63214 RepID=UPI0020C71EC2|nr:acid protease [Hypoxylon fragiforme]KAI2608848.1 acid protease [Hypoxylon fragiforme]
MTRSAVLALLGSLILELGAALPTDHMEQTLHFARQAGLAITENFHPLTRVQRSHRLTGGPDDYPISSGGVANLRAVAQQMQYVTQVGIEEERYYMVVDTGGADTWIVSEEFQCVDPNSGQEIAQERCMFGPLYNRDFPDGEICQNLNSTYNDGEYINGPMGFADITITDVTIPKQQFSIVNLAAWNGDGVSSGLLGLGFRAATTAYTGENPRNDSADNLVHYSPIMETLRTSKVADPIFSIAMSREESRSFIAFGGVPPVRTGEYTTVPILMETSPRTGITAYYVYSIEVDAISWNSGTIYHTETNLPHMFVESGTAVNVFPVNVAAGINMAYQPSGQLQDNIWYVPCDAIPPTLDIVIGGKAFRTTPSSMILPETATEGSNLCLSGIQVGEPNGYLLGIPFLQEILAVFDVSEKLELSLAQRFD